MSKTNNSNDDTTETNITLTGAINVCIPRRSKHISLIFLLLHLVIIMAGYPTEIFLSAPSELYLCAICREVLHRPRQCLQGHAYCCDCIDRHLAQSLAQSTEAVSSCPVCKCSLIQAGLARALVVENLIGLMQIRCPTTVSQCMVDNAHCGWVNIVDMLEEHKAECNHVMTACSNEGCSMSVEGRFLLDHEIHCDHMLVQCRDCPTMTKRAHLDDHDSICGEKLLECP